MLGKNWCPFQTLTYQIALWAWSHSWTHAVPQRRRHVLLQPALFLKSFWKLSGWRAPLGSAVVGTCTGIEVSFVFLVEWSYSATDTLIHYPAIQSAKKIRGQRRAPFLIGYQIYWLLAGAIFTVAISKKLPLSQAFTNLCSFQEMQAALLVVTSVSVLLVLFWFILETLFIHDLTEFRLVCWCSIIVLISGNST